MSARSSTSADLRSPGSDVVVGVIALAAATATMTVTPHFRSEAAHFFGSPAFGIASIFIVVGHSDLITENFLVPVTALRRGKLSKLKLAELRDEQHAADEVAGVALEPAITVFSGELHDRHGTRPISQAEFDEHFGHIPGDEEG